MTQHPSAARPYDPLWDGGAPRRPKGRWTRVAIGASLAAHAGLVWYVYEAKFAPKYTVYADDAVIAELVKPAKPPPPPPPPQQVKPEPAPQPPRPLDIRMPPMTPTIAAPSVIEIPAPPQPDPPAPPATPPVQAPPRVIANPNWSSRPDGADMARYYPERAQRLSASGSVTLQCQVAARGTVFGCSVLAESPAGLGFGKAAIELSRLFRMKPKMEDGQPVEGASVRIPIAFRIG